MILSLPPIILYSFGEARQLSWLFSFLIKNYLNAVLSPQVFFVTNNSTTTRAKCQAKFEAMGIDAPMHSILTSAWVAGAHLQSKVE